MSMQAFLVVLMVVVVIISTGSGQKKMTIPEPTKINYTDDLVERSHIMTCKCMEDMRAQGLSELAAFQYCRGLMGKWIQFFNPANCVPGEIIPLQTCTKVAEFKVSKELAAVLNPYGEEEGWF